MNKTTFICMLIIVLSSISIAQTIPSSKRSREVTSRIKLKLEPELTENNFEWGAPLYIRIFKKSKELELWLFENDSYALFRTYEICTYGSGSLGPKLDEGDGKAPEGFYYTTPQGLNPYSTFHLSFDVGYPNTYDQVNERTGSAIMVHGSCVSIGCFAMTDEGIEEIYTLVDAAFRNGQTFFRIHIFPFRMTDENLEEYCDSEWFEYWKNLKEGYDYFEENEHLPPNVTVRDSRYVFGN